MNIPGPICARSAACVLTALAGIAQAQQLPDENASARFQATYVWQQKRPFSAAYSGPHSLSAEREKSYSFTATAAFGFRPWQGGEAYFDPELAQGVPLSALTGLGGFTNGEIARTSGSEVGYGPAPSCSYSCRQPEGKLRFRSSPWALPVMPATVTDTPS